MLSNDDLNKRLAHYLRGTEPADVLQKYTSREFLLKNQARMLKQLNDPNRPTGYTTMLVLEPDITLPSATRIKVLPENRVRILDLMRSIDNPITGKFLLCRSLSPPVKMAASVVVVDDPEGEFCARFSMYNIFPSASGKKVKELLPVGTIMIVKNPYFKTSADGGYGLRSDNPGDILFMNEIQCQELFPRLKWKGEIPKMYSNLATKSTPRNTDEWKELGNIYFVKKNFVGALNAYSTGLKEDPQSVCLLSNRAAAYLQMEAYEMALDDVNAVLKIDPLHTKAIYRKIKGLCGLKRYKEALPLFEIVKSKKFEASQLHEWATLKLNVESYLRQEQTGDYDFAFMFKMAYTDTSYRFDYADYTGPVEVREAPGKGRGLFATENIKAGQLLIGCKAFALHIPEGTNTESHLNVTWNTMHMNMSIANRDKDALVSHVACILTNAPEKGKEFYKLYAGPELGFLRQEDGDDMSLVDRKRIKRICDLNIFEYQEETSIRMSHEGIWILPSFINHSCFDCNCYWIVFGDFMLVRAWKPIAKGEEILIKYFSPLLPFSERMEIFEKYRFLCDCRLCEADQKETKKTHQKREQWIQDLAALTHFSEGVVDDVNSLKYYFNRIASLRAKNPEMNIYIILPLMLLNTHFETNKQYTKSVETQEKVYDLIKDTPLRELIFTAIAGIVTSSARAGVTEKIQNWIEKLNEITVLTYGTVGVLDCLPHIVQAKQLLQQKGFSL